MYFLVVNNAPKTFPIQKSIDLISQAKKILKNIFGYDNFRPLQEEIISSVLNKNDSLVIMPTGGGKSLCYQIPALIFPGLTIVVSPLISLMKDQIEQLYELGIEATVLNSSLSQEEYSCNMLKVETGKAKLLYVAPETLMLDRFINFLKNINIDCITIDEAHCISEWGHDFRPEYRKLVALRDIFPEAVTFALTATATPRVQDDISASLKLKNAKKFVASFDRENLYLEVTPKYDALNQTIKFLHRYPNQSGIIYCFSRKQVDSLYLSLLNHGFSVKPYHAGLEDEERKINQELFIKDDIQIIVATIAFGMGINKPNVRFVIHYDLPKNIESYYQEIGRAGRDGLRSHCLLLFSYSDTMKIRYFIDQKEGHERRIALKHLQALTDYADSTECRRIPLLNYFGEKYKKHKCGMCENCNSEGRDLVDITIPAQKFLSCVKRTGEKFGAAHVIDILRGSKSQKITDWNHDQLSTYGIGNDYTKKQWLYISHQLIQKNLITPDQDYGSLKITDEGYQVLRGNSSIAGIIREDAEPVVKKVLSTDYDEELFEILRTRRKKLADHLRVPPYVIFSDKTLQEMAKLLPATKTDMFKIYGMGQIKYDRYGEIFKNEIIEFRKKKKITTTTPETPTPKKAQTSDKPKMNVTIGQMFNSGKSISEIMNETKFKRSTILGHLYTYSQNARLNNPDRLIEESSLGAEAIDKTLKAFSKLGHELLSPVFTELKEKVSYDELHLIRIYFLNNIKEEIR